MEDINPGRDLVIRLTIACGAAATLAICLRFLARLKTKASVGADDWWMLGSLIPSYSMLAVGSISPFIKSAFASQANDFSDYNRGRWPACWHIDRPPNGNILEGRRMQTNRSPCPYC